MISPRKIIGSAVVVSALLLSVSARAGFEFSGPAAPDLRADTVQDGNPVQIVPETSVEAETLAPLADEAILAAPATNMTPEPIGEEVYIPRQHTIEQAPMPIPLKAAAEQGGGLVINPYPLKEGKITDVYGDEPPVRVATPETTPTGRMMTRAAIPGRYSAGPPVTGVLRQPGAARVSPAVDTGSSYLTPIPGGEGPSLQAMQAQGSSVYPAAPVIKPLAPSVPVAYPSPVYGDVGAAPSQGQYAEAVGFGRDLPLALALSQVVPPEYKFSFGQGVNAGETVSWQGGKSWDAVLQDMLQPLGLRAVISGQQVTVQKSA